MSLLSEEKWDTITNFFISGASDPLSDEKATGKLIQYIQSQQQKPTCVPKMSAEHITQMLTEEGAKIISQSSQVKKAKPGPKKAGLYFWMFLIVQLL